MIGFIQATRKRAEGNRARLAARVCLRCAAEHSVPLRKLGPLDAPLRSYCQACVRSGDTYMTARCARRRREEDLQRKQLEARIVWLDV